MDWLFQSRYNLDFFLVAIPLQLIMIVYYLGRRHLPISESRSFLYLMVLNLSTLVTDIMACGVTVKGTPATVLYFWNILYFACFLLTASGFLLYTADALHIPRFAGRWTRAVVFLPVWVMLLFLFTTPWTGFFFASSPEVPFKDGPVYGGVYYCYGFYILLPNLLVLLKWRENGLRRNFSFLVCGALLLIGLFLRTEFRYMPIMGYFVTLAVLVVYFTLRNPDFYVDDETNLLNGPALHLVYTDRTRGRRLHGFGFVIKGFEQSRILYGEAFIDSFLLEIGKYIRRELPFCCGFYLRSGRFFLMTPLEKTEEAADTLRQRFRASWTQGTRTAFFDIACVYVDQEVLFPPWEEFRQALADGFQKARGVAVKEITVNQGYMEQLHRKFHVRRLLAEALANNSAEIFLQPLMEAGTYRILGAEALVRLKDRDGSLVLPDEFIPAAEGNGSISLLGLEVFGKVCRFIQEKKPQRWGMKWIQVNLSPMQCLDRHLPDKLDALRKAHEVPVSAVRLEITEQAAMGNSGYQRVNELVERGYTLVLDDYGSGYSNRQRMNRISVAGIKLDGHLVGSHFDHPDSYIPNLIKGMRQSGYEVTAEGVETKEMADSLSAMGCTSLQGFYFAPPLTLSQFEKMYGT